jgi:hypothetical protein
LPSGHLVVVLVLVLVVVLVLGACSFGIEDEDEDDLRQEGQRIPRGGKFFRLPAHQSVRMGLFGTGTVVA